MYMYVHKIVCIILFVKWTKMSRITQHILGGSRTKQIADTKDFYTFPSPTTQLFWRMGVI